MKIRITAFTLLALMSFAGAPAPAQQQVQPVITALPHNAVTIQSCNWKTTYNSFDADIRLKDNTNLKIAKSRLLLTFTNDYGENVSAYADMDGGSVTPAPGMKLMGKWLHGTFPMNLKNISCALVGVKFVGYPNVIFSAVNR